MEDGVRGEGTAREASLPKGSEVAKDGGREEGERGGK